jgi:hypothetical protein
MAATRATVFTKEEYAEYLVWNRIAPPILLKPPVSSSGFSQPSPAGFSNPVFNYRSRITDMGIISAFENALRNARMLGEIEENRGT